jgi:hypothetical protein
MMDSRVKRFCSYFSQVACRDYPHARYLCVKFPFKSTSHEKYCEQVLLCSVGIEIKCNVYVSVRIFLENINMVVVEEN